MKAKTRVFSRKEAAIAYAAAAERMISQKDDFFKRKPACVPVFVTLLFQSLEISIKELGIRSKLFSEEESRSSKKCRSGHGISELTKLAAERLNGPSADSVVVALAYRNKQWNSQDIIKKMICGPEFERTRESYASRRLGYAEIAEGDFAILEPLSAWVAAVKETAINLQTSIDIVSQWKNSKSHSRHFAIWIRRRG